MKNHCPKCSGTATVTQGRFRDLTSARFDTEYTDGRFGMAPGVKIICPACGELNFYLSDWRSLLRNEITPEDISRFQRAYPSYFGVIPLSTWLDSFHAENPD